MYGRCTLAGGLLVLSSRWHDLQVKRSVGRGAASGEANRAGPSVRLDFVGGSAVSVWRGLGRTVLSASVGAGGTRALGGVKGPVGGGIASGVSGVWANGGGAATGG